MKKNQTNPKILLVDDNSENLDVLSGILSEYKCYIALNGETALKIANSANKPDLILLDIMMPGMDGYEVIKQLKDSINTRDIPVIFLTGNTEIEDETKGLKLGAVDYIGKPFNSLIILARIKTHLEIKAQHDELQDLLKRTLSGSIKVLTEILAMLSPKVFNKVTRLRRYMTDMVNHLNLENRWQYILASMLSQIGYITLPAEIIDKILDAKKVTPEEQQIIAKCPKIASELIENIPRLENVAGMVANQELLFDSLSFTEKQLYANPELLGGHILKIINDYDLHIQCGLTPEMALKAMMGAENVYMPSLLEVLRSNLQLTEPLMIPKNLKLGEMRTGMIFNESVFSNENLLLVSDGMEITLPLIKKLEHFTKLSIVENRTFRVLVSA